jgi:hypothetical protein
MPRHAVGSGGVQRFPILSHPDSLAFPALTTHASLHICDVRAVLQVVPAGRRQRSVQLFGPFLVGPGEPPHLIGSQAKITKHRAERLAAVNGVEELLPQLKWEPLLRSGSSPSSLVVGMCPGAQGTMAPAVPARVRAVPRIAHRRTLARTGLGCEPFTGRRSTALIHY